MTITLGVVMDPISAINYKKDSTLAMLLAAQEKGWQLKYLELSDLYLENGVAKGRMASLKVFADPNKWYELEAAVDQDLSSLDVILMRKDPPFDNEFLYATHILEYAERAGTLVVNRPESLRNFNEKLFATQFPQCCPPLIVSRDMQRLRAFYQEHGDVVFKPLDGMGGMSVFRVKPNDPNVSVILETLTALGTQQIMGQKFIPEISNGDKRILLIDGEPVAYALARVPAVGENRGNLAAGGTGVGTALSERDHWICQQVAPKIKSSGLLFVGLDVIGDFLTEINVTSPTCIRELDNQYSLNIGGQLMDCIEAKLNAQS